MSYSNFYFTNKPSVRVSSATMEADSSSSLLRASTTPPVSHTMPSTFRMPHCLADGQLTPPESPDAPNSKPATRNGPRLQLPRLLRRTKTDHDQPHLSVRRTSPVRPYVSEMKAPFPLRLPDSPTESDCSSSPSSSPMFAPELRRRSPTYHDLRSLAAQQKRQISRRVNTPLLPSPIEKDEMTQSDSYFTFNNPRKPRPKEYHSYQDLHILSCYCEDKDKQDANVDSPARRVEGSEDTRQDDDSRSISTVDTPTTPTDQIYRISAYQSDESGWLANQSSLEERRFKARCYQVVQQVPTDANKDEDVVSNPVLQITGCANYPDRRQDCRPRQAQACSDLTSYINVHIFHFHLYGPPPIDH